VSPYIRKIDSFATNPYIVITASISSIGGFAWLLYEKVQENSTIPFAILAIILCLIFAIIAFFALMLHKENAKLKSIASTFTDINYLYKASLKSVLKCEKEYTKEDLMFEEKSVLGAVCQRIEDIFTTVINRKCMVTVKLLIEEDEKKYAYTYTRSKDKCQRDQQGLIKKYLIGPSHNTGFSEAITKKSASEIRYYFSPDLTKEKNYFNERQKYTDHYRSVLVVPIAAINQDSIDTDRELDLLGFLCVDTKSINRLNDNYHLFILSSLASQMYNYMTFMRCDNLCD